MFDLETTASIKKISFVFFAVLGITHFLAGAMAGQNVNLPASDIVMRISFLPFVLASLVYLFGILKESQLKRGKIGKILEYTFAGVIGIVTLSFFFLEFYFTDKTLPL